MFWQRLCSLQESHDHKTSWLLIPMGSMGNMTPTWGSTSQGPVQVPITLEDAQSELQLARAIGFLASGGSAHGRFIPLVREAFEVQLKISESKKISPKIGLWHLLLSSTCLLATVEAAMIIFFVYHLRIIYKLMIPKLTIFCLYRWEWLKIVGVPCFFFGLGHPSSIKMIHPCCFIQVI